MYFNLKISSFQQFFLIHGNVEMRLGDADKLVMQVGNIVTVPQGKLSYFLIKI